MAIDSLIKKYVSAFGFLFTDLEVRDWNDTTNAWDKHITVPVSYGPKEKMLARLERREGDQPDKGYGIALTLPRIAFEHTSIEYDATRVNNKLNYYVNEVDGNGNMVEKIYVGIPYNLYFEVSVLAKYAEHGTQIIEQILPFFNPQFNLRLKVTGRQNINIDTPIILTSVSTSDTYEGSFTTRRAITWTLGFTMKVLMFSGLGEDGVGAGNAIQGSIIKTAIENVGTIDNKDNLNKFEKLTTIPVVAGKTLDEITEADDWTALTTKENL